MIQADYTLLLKKGIKDTPDHVAKALKTQYSGHCYRLAQSRGRLSFRFFRADYIIEDFEELKNIVESK
jgi:hypothetical protein